MAIREKSSTTQAGEVACYQTRHGGSPTLLVSTPQKNWVFAYTHLLYADWNPSGELVVVFATHQVRIRGRHLKILYEYLGNFSLSHIYQENSQGIPIPETATWIEEIRVLPTQETGE